MTHDPGPPNPPDVPDDPRPWTRYARAVAGPPGACPDPLDLAAWLDGRLPDDRRDAVDEHLVACPACLDAIRAGRAALDDDTLGFVSPRVLEGARALVSGRRRSDHAWWAAARRVGAVAAMLAVSVLGYMVGPRSVRPAPPSEERLLASMSFDVFASADDSELLSLLGGEVTP